MLRVNLKPILHLDARYYLTQRNTGEPTIIRDINNKMDPWVILQQWFSSVGPSDGFITKAQAWEFFMQFGKYLLPLTDNMGVGVCAKSNGGDWRKIQTTSWMGSPWGQAPSRKGVQ